MLCTRLGASRLNTRVQQLRTRSMASGSDTPQDVIICGGGIISASIAFHLTQLGVKPLVIERKGVGCAASGKAGGFLARSWGDGSCTQELHHVSYDLHESLAKSLNITSYRKIRTVSVRTTKAGAASARRPQPRAADWLDGHLTWKDMGPDTAQVTPLEVTTRLMDAAIANGAEVRSGVVDGVDVDSSGAIFAVRVDGAPLPCRRAVFAMGPWTCNVSRWLKDVMVPIEGIMSSSMVYRSEELKAAISSDPVALFCAEDARYSTHLEAYPRSNGEVYVCGLGGNDYPRGRVVGAARLAPGGDSEAQSDSWAPSAERAAAAHASFKGMVSLAADPPGLTQACMRPVAPDALPIVGSIPGHSGAFIATGTNCWGILWAPAIGKAVAELLVHGKEVCVSLDPFSIERFYPSKVGGRGRKMGAVPVGEQW